MRKELWPRGSAQRDRRNEKKEHTSRQTCFKVNAAGGVCISYYLQIHSQQTTLFFLHVLFVCICLLAYLFLPALMNSRWGSCQFRSQNDPKIHFKIM